MATLIATKVARKFLSDRAEQYEPPDPHYEYSEDANGRKIRKKRPVPPGLSKKEARILKKIRKRAHHLDKGMNICGFKVGYTFFIGIIPGAGDVANALLNYTMVYRPCKALDLPGDIKGKMLLNNAVSFGVGVIPVAGDIMMAAWRANSRNAHLVEAYLTIRGQEYLASTNQGAPVIPEGGFMGVSAAAIRRFFMGDVTHGVEAAERTAGDYGASGTSTPAGSGMAINQAQVQAPATASAPAKRNGNGTAGAAPIVGVQGAQGVRR